MGAKPTAVYLEVGAKKVFADAADWPGWCRAGKDEESALEALAAAAPRYAEVAERAGVRSPARAADSFQVVEQLQGNATTDFGAPGAIAAGDRQPLTKAKAERLASLLEAAWALLDDVVRTAPPTLRKGPRGGGRDRDAVAQHVLAAEVAYGRKLGVRFPEPMLGDNAAITAARRAVIEAIRSARSGEPEVEKNWPARYAVRRITWHVLDHAWEIQDKSE
jgi:hypothetical protein